MKTKISKRLLSLFLSVLMIVTSVPMTAITALAAGSTVSSLTTQINEFERLMGLGKVYKNMLPAYNAYIKALGAIDAYKYGGASSSVLDTAETNLSALLPMTEFTGYTGTATGKWMTNTQGTSTYSNLLYCSSGSADVKWNAKAVEGDTSWNANNSTIGEDSNYAYFGKATKSRMQFKMPIQSEVTLLYDGTNPSYFSHKVEIGFYNRQRNNDRVLNWIACATNGFKYTKNWGGDTTAYDSWADSPSTKSCGYLTTATTSVNFTSANNSGDQTKTWFFVNSLTVDSSTITSLFEDYKYTVTEPKIKVKWAGDTGGVLKNNESPSITVIDYSALTSAIKANSVTNALKQVSSYKEGGLTALLTALDAATSYNPNTDFSTGNNVSTCTGHIDSYIGGIRDAVKTPDVNTASYQKIRDTLDGDYLESGYDGHDKLGRTISQSHAANSSDYDPDLYDAFDDAYSAATAAMLNTYNNGYSNASSISTVANTLVSTHRDLGAVAVPTPTITGNTLLGPEDGLTITVPSDVDSVSYTVNGGTAQTITEDTIVYPCANVASGTDTVMVSAYSTSGTDNSATVSKTVTYFKAPNFSVANNATIAADATISITTGMGTLQGTLQYSLDGGTTWVPATSVQPFVTNTDRLVMTVMAREITDGATSAVAQILVAKEASFSIYAVTNGVSSEDSFGNGGVFYIQNADSYNDTIYYTVSVDGGTPTAMTAYNHSTGISSTPYAKSAVVTIRAYSISGGSTTIAEQSFNNNDFNTLIYHESFDGASVSGTRFTTGSLYGVNGTLKHSGTLSVVAGAGDKHGNPSVTYVKDYDGLSADWRENVLKINPASSSSDDNSLTLDSNPFATATTPIKNYIRSHGLTISFWRHYESSDGVAASIPAPSESKWRDVLYFSTGGLGTDNADYFMVMGEGTTAYRQNSNSYLNYVPNNQDQTSNAAGNNAGYWINYVVTVNPDSGITVYADGDPHEVSIKTGSSGISGNNAAAAQQLIDYLLDSNTKVYFNNSNGWSNAENEKTVYLDDIRFYAESLKQVDIYNMYNDEDTDLHKDKDIKTKDTATSHDPTNVTVYTIAAGTYTGLDGSTFVAPAGKTVGKEFIEYYNVQSSQIVDINYYSFGTGMTIYKSHDNINWTVIGDSAGRCGYWNEDLFGGPMKTILNDQQNYVINNGGRGHDGAGNLVWAPHVMYNLVRNKWVMYAACSVWGTSTAVTFMAVSSDDTIEHYQYVADIKKSSARPNVIDSCTIYGRDADGNIDKSRLYMSHGAWSDASDPLKDLVLCQLYEDGTSRSTANTPGGGDPTSKYIGTSINVNTEKNYYTGEGSYLFYNDGYYYLYVSYGENKGNYSERVYRIENIANVIAGTDMFKDYFGVPSTNNTKNLTVNGTTLKNVGSDFNSQRGHQILNSHYDPITNYYYTSTGHNSIYKAVNNNGDDIILNAAHARQLSGPNNNWKALEDPTFSTRQIELTGNITIINPVVQTDNGWPLLLPYQYNGTDKTSVTYSLEDVCGIYRGSDFASVIGDSVADSYYFNITMNDADETGNTALFCGTRSDGSGFNYLMTITNHPNHGGHTHFNLFDYSDKNCTTPLFEGTFGEHTENGVRIPEFGLCSTVANNHFVSWGYRYSSIPDIDRESDGDIIQHSGIIYTHEHGDNHGLYGREISDNFYYGTEMTESGERCTIVTTTYPYYIETDSATAIYSISGNKYTQQGYVGDTIKAVDIYGLWYDSNNRSYTDAQAAAAYAADPEIVLTKSYGLRGFVSSYFMYGNGPDGGYPETGITVLINYVNKETGEDWGEYEFFYVMPNPDWAHEVIAIRNQYNNGAYISSRKVDMAVANATFSRFVDSEGTSTGVVSSMTNGLGATASGTSSTGESYLRSLGNFLYTVNFGNSESVSYSYTSPRNIADKFLFYNTNQGVTAGSYACLEHTNDKQYDYGISSAVVNADYYIDYSDSSQYGKRITMNSELNAPDGYTFDLKLSNLYWNPRVESYYAASYARNLTGLNVSYSSSVADSNKIETQNDTKWLDFNLENDQVNHSSYGAYSMMTSQGGFSRAFPALAKSSAATNSFTGTATFTGSDTVKKSSDTSSAESLANYILETSLITSYGYEFNIGGTPQKTGYSGEANYHYYNIGVSTCDKGAVRDFLEQYANKDLTKVYDSNNKLYLVAGEGIHSGDYSVASYEAYLDALAQAYFFLENPHNTTYNGTGDDATPANDIDGQHEYTTAYRESAVSVLCHDEKGNDYVVKRPQYSAIYNNRELGGGSDIFKTGTTETDPVQTMLIDNVIKAYFELFKDKDYTAAENRISAALAETDKIVFDNTDGKYVVAHPENYTAESIAQFESAANLAVDHIGYDLTLDPEDRENYWRYVKLTQPEYEDLISYLETTEEALMPIVDTAELGSTIDDKNEILENGIFENSEQKFTMQSWTDLNTATKSAKDLKQTEDVERNEKYAYGAPLEANILKTEYDYYEMYNENNLSEHQIAVNDENTSLAPKTLNNVDEFSAYQNFDAAAEIVATIDRDKYTAEGLAAIDAYYAQFKNGVDNNITVNNVNTDSVYASVQDITAYNAKANTTIPAGAQIKRTTTGETDKFTDALLSILNENIKQFDAYLIVQNDDAQDSAIVGEYLYETLPYGSMFDIDLDTVNGVNIGDNDSVYWSVAVYGNDGGYVPGADSVPTASQKVSCNNTAVLERKADADIIVTAVVVRGEAPQTNYKVIVTDIYGKTSYVDYVTSPDAVTANGATLSIGGTERPNAKIPFWTITGWNISDPVDNVITVTPNVVTDTNCKYTVIGGTRSEINTRYDKTVYLDSNLTDFYAWAIRGNNVNEYAIVSYSKNYAFQAIVDQTYVAIVSETTTNEVTGEEVTVYKAKTESGYETLNVNNVVNALPESFNDGANSIKSKLGNISADEFLNKKLDNKAPFVYIEHIVDARSEGFLRAYVRVTEGAENLTGYGVYVNFNTYEDLKYPCNNVLPSGQFLLTVRTGGLDINKFEFQGYVTYDFSYSFTEIDGVTTHDYSIAAVDKTAYLNALNA